MKLLTASCVAALLATTAMYAQTTTGSTVVGSMTVTATVIPNTGSGSAATKQTVGNEIRIFRGSDGKIEYRMSAAKAHVVQTDGSIDQATTGEIFNALAAEAVRQGTSLGYTSGSGTVQTSVSTESRIDRLGSGINTQFDPDETSPTLKQIFNVSADGSTQYVGTYTQTNGSESSVVQ